jgi:hypothetical protein
MEVISIKVSPAKHKKYRADVLIDGKLHKSVDFGDKRYQHYKDMTKLKAYSYLDHNDWKRKESFHKRHAHNVGPAALLSKEFLW